MTTKLNDVLEKDFITPGGIRQRLSLEYVASKYGVTFNREGKAKCPFHEDRRPSFRLWKDDDDVERWHCFPCAAGGDVFDFIGRMEGYSFGASLTKAIKLMNNIPKDWEPTLTLEASAFGPEDWNGFVFNAMELAGTDSAGLARAAGLPEELGPVLLNWGVGFAADEIFGHDLTAHTLWPHWSTDGLLMGCKTRSPNGEKWSMPGSSYTYLYGAWRSQLNPAVMLCEGERDTVFADYRRGLEGLDIDVYGLPRGATSQITREMLEPIRKYSDVYLAFDGDETGETAVRIWRGVFPAAHRMMLPSGSDMCDYSGTITDLVRTST